ncbi:MAG: 23S rRNA (uracil(1939)-C(5))-methyltransferase RlmD [Clostridia bacterium]|nr:23S rRNA (uracil(1939)-C(5))-methyltransferase RlmD [Clostridia bacterium]
MTETGGIFRVTDTNSRGYGIIKDNEKIIFAAGAVEGDVCRIEITGEEKNYLTARITDLIEPSPYRVNPDCPYYGECGGCSLRHAAYETEGEIKKRVVSSAFRRFGINAKIGNVLCPSPDFYRNKVSFKVDGPRVGFYRKETNDVVPLDRAPCKTAPAHFSQIANETAATLCSLNINAEEIAIRSSVSGDLSAVISLKGMPDSIAELNRFRENVSSLSVRDTLSKKNVRLFGDGGIRTEAFGLSLFVSDDSFFQVNYEGAEILFRVVSSLFDDMNFDLCADLFCGTGVWGLALAKRFPDKRFYGIDLNKSAINDAIRNAERNGIKNIKFYCGDAAMKTEEGIPSAVIVDPPRAGLHPSMIDVLKDLSPDYLVYISCNPFTLARDAAKMVEFGYRIKCIAPVNLFPRTEHVETVVLMSRGG